MTIDQFVNTLLALRVQYPFSVTSWIRTDKRNRLVGGLDDSYHILALAVDLVLDNPLDNDGFCNRARKLGLTAIVELDHIHVQAKGLS